MPATCFNRLPRGAGVIAQRCRLSLQGLSETWLRYARFQPFAASCAHWWAKMHYKKAPHSCWRLRLRHCAARACLLLLVSYWTLARLERSAAARA